MKPSVEWNRSERKCAICLKLFKPLSNVTRFCELCRPESVRRAGLKAAKHFYKTHPDYVAFNFKIRTIRQYLARAIRSSEMAMDKVNHYAQLLAIEIAKESNKRKTRGRRTKEKQFTPFMEQKITIVKTQK